MKPPAKTFSNKSLIREVFLICCFFGSVYALTLSQNLSDAHDSIYYVNSIEQGKLPDLFHPHHLLYNWVSARWMDAGHTLLPHRENIVLVELLNCLFGALTLGCFFLILRNRLEFSFPLAALGTALPAFSFGVWFYSTTVEVYIIPLFFLSAAFYFLTSQKLGRCQLAIIGITHGLAVLSHQIHVLFLLVVLYVIFRESSLLDRSRIKAAWTYLLNLTVVTATPYLVIMIWVHKLHSIEAMLDWLTTYAQNAGYWHAPGFASFVKASFGFSQSFIGGHFLFANPALAQELTRTLSGNVLTDQMFLVRHLSSTQSSLLLLLSGIVVIAVLLHVVFCWKRHRQPMFQAIRLCFKTALVWFLIYSGFFIFWVPTNREFWIPQSLAFWLLFLCLWPKRSGSLRRFESLSCTVTTSTIALLLGIINFFGSIQWLMHRTNDAYYTRISPLIELSQKDDVIVIRDPWILDAYLKRYTDCQFIVVSSDSSTIPASVTTVKSIPGLIEKMLGEGSDVFIFDEVLEESGLRNSLLPLYQNKWTRITTEAGVVYALMSENS